jgi:hypothetical protein
MAFGKILLPATPTPLGTLFGLPSKLMKYSFRFPSTNLASATIALPPDAGAGVVAVTAVPGSGSEMVTDNINNVSVSGTITDYIVLEYYRDFY